MKYIVVQFPDGKYAVRKRFMHWCHFASIDHHKTEAYLIERKVRHNFSPIHYSKFESNFINYCLTDDLLIAQTVRDQLNNNPPNSKYKCFSARVIK